MVRVGRDAKGKWYLGRGTGRGVWWCNAKACEAVVGIAHVARALKTTVFESDVVALQGLATGKRL
jgi:hypothetical protein